MKPKYTITIKDNDSGKNMFEFDVDAFSSEVKDINRVLSSEKTAIDVPGHYMVRVEAKFFRPAQNSLPTVYNIDEDDDELPSAKDDESADSAWGGPCDDHTFVETAQGFTRSYYVCKHCGTRKEEEE